MIFFLTDNHWCLDGIIPFEWLPLGQLPDVASGQQFETATDRLFPSPLEEDSEVDESMLSLLDDWDEIIRPDLSAVFRSHRNIVAQDLSQATTRQFSECDETDPVRIMIEKAGIQEEDLELRRLLIPNDHTEAWYSTLNQARLLMHEKYKIAELDSDWIRSLVHEAITDEQRNHLYIELFFRVYGLLQDSLLENVMTVE